MRRPLSSYFSDTLLSKILKFVFEISEGFWEISFELSLNYLSRHYSLIGIWQRKINSCRLHDMCQLVDVMFWDFAIQFFVFFTQVICKTVISMDTGCKLKVQKIFRRYPGLHVQSWTKYLETFSLFSIIFLHHKWSGTRLLSPGSKCTSYLTSCRTT